MRRPKACAAALVISVLVVARAASGSGVWSSEVSFVAEGQPEPPLDKYVAGNLGLIQPNWDRSYLYVAYRWMEGPGFDPDEQKVMLAIWSKPAWPQPDTTPQDLWIQARNQIPDTTPLEQFDSFAPTGEFESFRNCHDDAFHAATATLATMVAKFGGSSVQAKAWLEAQDTVFENCPGAKDNPHIPDALKDATPFEQAQRAYQIAAAEFYGENFDAAIKDFNAIGADRNSPWREIAPYLVARATIRKATLSGEENDKALLADAQRQLNAIVASAAPADLKTSAKALLGFVGCRIDPEARHADAVHAIMRRGDAATLEQDLENYNKCGTPRREGDFPAEDLDDWLAAWGADPSHAIDKWKRLKSLPWLVVSIAASHGSDPEVAPLLDAARGIKPDSPAYLTVEYHLDRILLEQGKNDEAKKRLDAILAKPDPLMRAAYNAFATLRVKLATNLEEFLRYGLRYPVAIVAEGSIFLADPDFDKDFTDAQEFRRETAVPMLDRDDTDAIDAWMPLGILKQAAHSSILPPPLRGRLAMTVWVRAVLLGDEGAAREMIPMIVEFAPQLKVSLEAWSAAKNPNQRRFEVAVTMLRNPGLRPYLDSGFGRLTPLDQPDALRDNFWTSMSPPLPMPTPKNTPQVVMPTALPTPVPPPKYPAFLSPDERKSADVEWDKLARIDGAEFLCSEALQYAKTNPKEGRIAEALFRCILAVHLSAANDHCDVLADSAFHLLHQRYPNSEWAKKNRFWYHAQGAPWRAAYGR
ncbi:MAG TPA: hypothetical protein VKV03_16990 [Candidatus Binataceae bacterium]|nr:hypothetical protein [Candidatus Binataceae bacterium]